jgi:hypothetical protein
MNYSYQPDEFFSIANDQALNQQQVQALLDWYYERARSIDGESAEKDMSDLAAREAAIREALGDDSETAIDLGRRAAAKLFGQASEDVMSIELSNGEMLGDHPLFIRALAMAGQQLAVQPEDELRADPEKTKALQRIQALRKLQDTDRLAYESPETQASLRAAYDQAYPGA